MKSIFLVLMLLNTAWFFAAFWFFSIQSKKAVKLLLSKEHRQPPYFDILAHALKFLGGMNMAFAILAIFAGTNPDAVGQKTLLLLVFSAAHFSQFVFNLPLALKEQKQQSSLWPVLRGTMFFIFVVDATLAVFNLVLAVII
jgi:hypothetical protein